MVMNKFVGAQFEKGCAAVLEKPNPESKGKAPVLDEKAHRGGGGGGGFHGPRREAPMDDDDVPEKDLLLAKVRKLEEEEISFRGESETIILASTNYHSCFYKLSFLVPQTIISFLEAEKELASRIPVSRNPSGDDAV
ncbi:hypothetical protein SASPL_136498 [Salvia splendens]|uniref:Uncharacterized protein n=1 Tax=Salvia splendens TaxID=180675 RepID=A0A8X8ZGN7_SALSN|nr:hypothetical protein SASPL_136498 [Salvia splendens]